MSSISVLHYTEDDRISILKEYGRSPEIVHQDIANIKEWMAKQPHLPEIPDDNLIERFLLINKFRVEIVKKKLDMYYTARSVAPELYNKDPNSPEIQKIMDVVYCVVLPKLTKDLYRVTVNKLKDPNPDNFDPVHFAAYAFSIADIRLREDYSLSEVQIFDFAGITLGHLLKLNPIFMQKVGFVIQKVFSNRVVGIHFVNAPVFTESFLYLLKTVLNPKVVERVHIHKDWESLQKFVPKDVLPKDFGGNEKSLDELSDVWKQKLLECGQLFAYLRKLSVNEKLRPEKLPIDDLFGTDGNFRKLDLD